MMSSIHSMNITVFGFVLLYHLTHIKYDFKNIRSLLFDDERWHRNDFYMYALVCSCSEILAQL